MDAQTFQAREAGPRRGPRVTVLTAAYNAEPYIAQCIESIFSQTFADFELIVVDDASTDRTPEILARYHDPRLRLVRNERNLGVVGARNRGMAMARGELIAPFDADDVSLPTRLARQVMFLDASPSTALVGTGTFYLEQGVTRPGRSVYGTSPMMLRWLLHVGNPFGHSTLMYRASTVASLGQFLLDEYRYAEDFEFCHRVMRVGQLGFINEPLLLYRRHPGGVSVQHEAQMVAQSCRVLTAAYRPWFGAEADTLAAFVITYLFGRKPPLDSRTLTQVGAVLNRLLEAFLAHNPVDPNDRADIVGQASALWWDVVRSSVRSGFMGAHLVPPPPFVAHRGPGLTSAAVSTMSGLVPYKQTMLPRIRNLEQAVGPRPIAAPATTQLSGVTYRTVPPDPERPATLFVVIDTEAEFDWSAPFDRALTNVTAMRAVERGQAVFDRYGLRPIYVADYAVLSQEEGYRPLQAIYDRGGCEVGAHLHPWITPPFEEELSVHNSYAGNLPVELERRKLRVLLDQFRATFGFDARFFKAGRYGVGPNTMALLAESGICVDLSVIPGRDLSPHGGPDFRAFTSAPQSVLDGRIACLPMTRGQTGVLAGRPTGVGGLLKTRLAKRASLPGILSRLHLLETATLTPEGVPARTQIALIHTMLAQKQRQLVLHYHSPSLAPGFTPYGQTEDDVNRIVRRLEKVCCEFIERLGGVPGDPQDLLPPEHRTLTPAAQRVVQAWEQPAL